VGQTAAIVSHLFSIVGGGSLGSQWRCGGALCGAEAPRGLKPTLQGDWHAV
jgi:hypothetical protein